MSTVVLTKNADCAHNHCDTITIDCPTRFTFSGAPTHLITPPGGVQQTVENGVFDAFVAGDYVVCLQGVCKHGQVCTDPIMAAAPKAPAEPPPIDPAVIECLEAIKALIEAQQDFEIVNSGWICGEDGTWVRETTVYTDGVPGEPTVIDSGISCEEPAPLDTVTVQKLEVCDPTTKTLHIKVCQYVTSFNDEGEPTTVETELSYTDTGVKCDVPQLFKECLKDKFVEGGLDNTKTNFTHTNQVYSVEFSDGTTGTFTIASASDWSDQVTQMASGLDSLMPWAQTVEPFCTSGCGGLPAPVFELNQMVARYVGFRVCIGDVVPVAVSYDSDQTKVPADLILEYKETPTIYIDVCSECVGDKEYTVDGEPYIPVCPIPCSEEFPEIPLPSCTTSSIAGNWCDVDIDVYENPDDDSDPVIASDIIVLATSCNGSVPEFSYYTADADGTLNPYELQGEIRSCDNLDLAPESEPVCRPEGQYTGKTFCYSKKGKFLLVEKQFEGSAGTVDVSADLGLPTGSVVATTDATIFSGANSDILACADDTPVNFSVSGTQPVCIKVQHGGSIPTDGASDGFTANDGVAYDFTGNITGDGVVSKSGDNYAVTAGTDNVQGGINWTSQVAATSATATTTNASPANSVRFWVATFDCSEAQEYTSDCGEIVQWWDGNEQVNIDELEPSDCCSPKDETCCPITKKCYTTPAVTETIQGSQAEPWIIIAGDLELVRVAGQGGVGFSNNASPNPLEFSSNGIDFGTFSDELGGQGGLVGQTIWVRNPDTGTVQQLSIITWQGANFTGEANVGTPEQNHCVVEYKDGSEVITNELGNVVDSLPEGAEQVKCPSDYDKLSDIEDALLKQEDLGLRKCYRKAIDFFDALDSVDTGNRVLSDDICVTPDEDGVLTEIRLRVDNLHPFNGANTIHDIVNFTFDGQPIVPTTNLNYFSGNPYGAVLESASPGINEFRFEGLNIPIVAGQKYTISALLANGPDPDILWQQNDDNANGQIEYTGAQDGNYPALHWIGEGFEEFTVRAYCDGSTKTFNCLNEEIEELPSSAEQYCCGEELPETDWWEQFKTKCTSSDSPIIPDANYEGGIEWSIGRPNNDVEWILWDNTSQPSVEYVKGATFAEFVTNMEAIGYTEWSSGESHYFCPCPPNLVNAGDYFVTADGNTVTKPACIPLGELPNAPEKEVVEEFCALRTKGCLDQAILDSSNQTNTLLEELIACMCECPDCPELVVGDTVNSTTSDVLSFPLSADSEVLPFTTPITIEDNECLGEEIVIRVTQDHEAGAFPNHRGYILSASAGIWTAESASNTFETAGATGTANIGIGYAATDTVANQRNTRWTELTVAKADLLAGITLSGLGFGGFGGATEDIYSMSYEIVGGTENCDGC